VYFPLRFEQGGEMLAPGSPSDPLQIIDVRDLAEWTLAMVEAQRTGVYNATGPAEPLTMAGLLGVCRSVSTSDARVTWVDEAFLAEREVGPWMELPLWIPESDPDSVGFSDVSVRKALDAGLTFRDLNTTVRDTLAWDATRPAGHEWRAGLKPEREAELLAAWHAKEAGND
jgi:2'-hydroxyisoflavone reductase